MVGTITLYDAAGEVLEKILANAPEDGKATFYERLRREIKAIKQRYPVARWAGVSDGARDHVGFGVLAYNLHKIGAKLLSNQSKEKEKQEKEKPGSPKKESRLIRRWKRKTKGKRSPKDPAWRGGPIEQQKHAIRAEILRLHKFDARKTSGKVNETWRKFAEIRNSVGFLPDTN